MAIPHHSRRQSLSWHAKLAWYYLDTIERLVLLKSYMIGTNWQHLSNTNTVKLVICSRGWEGLRSQTSTCAF